MKRQHGFGVIEIMVIVALVAAIGVGGWYVWQAQQTNPNTVSTPPPPSAQNVEPTPPPQTTTKKYTNTKYGYSFEYPAEAEIYSDIPYGGVKTPITAESDIAIVRVGQNRFNVGPLFGDNQLDADMIHRWFTSHSREQVNIAPITINNGTGFLAILSDSETKHYFLKNTPNSPIFYLRVETGAQSLAESFKFE